MRVYAVFFGCIGCCWALPQSPQILEGTAKFTSSAGRLEIETADRTLIEWESFSIDKNEAAYFIQPSTKSAVLNRVMTSMPSLLQGKLESNGQVMLINPNGILVGKDAVIDTGSFIASTLDVKNQSFRDNMEFLFEGSSLNGICNEGSIITSDGDLLFIGHTVRNEGHLETQNGSVALLASQQVILKPAGLERIFVQGASFSDAFIHPDDPDWDFVSQSIHDGTIRASFSDGTGGNVYLCGEQVLLSEGSKIDASGDFGGGNVWLGGEYQGKNEKIDNARYAWIEPGAEIDTSCKSEGDGGQIIIWSQMGTTFFGKALAGGGPLGGNGGLVEVSGREYLNFSGKVNAAAPLGLSGKLLLDPNDITISAGATSGGAFPVTGTFFSGAGFPAATLNVGELIAALNNPTNVLVQTDSPTVGGFGDITVLDPVAWSSIASLTLDARRDIYVNADIQNAGTGAVTLIACRDVTLDSNTPTPFRFVSVGSRDGTTRVTAGQDLIMNGNDIQVVPPPDSVATQIGWRAVNLDVITGDIVANAGRDILLNSGTGWDQSVAIGHGNFYRFTVPPAFSFTVDADVTVRAGQDIILSTFDGVRKGCLIGHGFIVVDTCTLNGRIEVTCARDLTFQNLGLGNTPPFFLNLGSHALIGFHVFSFNIAPCSYSGQVVVNVGGNFLITPATVGNFSSLGIGTSVFTATTETVSVETNIGGSITLNGNNALGERAFIGKLSFAASGATLMGGDVSVNCGGPILMNALTAQRCFIGYALAGAGYSGNVNVNVNSRGNIDIITTPTSPQTFIGMVHPTLSTLYTLTGDTSVITTGSISINGAATSGINSNGNVYVQAGGNIIASGNSFIGTERPNVGTTTTILAGGNIIGTPPAIFGNGYMGPFYAPHNNSLMMGTGGDIQMPNSFVTTAGSITLASDTFIPAINIIVPPFSTNFSNCDGLTINVTRPSFALTGPSILPNGVGCFSTAPPIFLTTTTGNITLHSAPRSAQTAASCDLDIGNDVILTTDSGNIEVFGAIFPGPCVRGNSFNNVTISQNICTTGSVLIAANNNLTMTAGSSIGGTACGVSIPSSVTLIVDNQFPRRPLLGSGGFFMDVNAEINSTGPIRIFTAMQNINTIDGLIRNVRFGKGTLFACTTQESWCTYFCSINSDCPMSGVPFTISYKDGCPVVPPEVPRIINEFLVDLHPYDEFPGWMMRFWIEDEWQPLDEYPVALCSEPYMLRRRHLNLLNHPKTWSQIVEDTRPGPVGSGTRPSRSAL